MKYKFISMASAVAVLFSGTASAQVFSPSSTYTWRGVVEVNKPPSPAFFCNLEVDVSPNTTPPPDASLTRVEFTAGPGAPPGLCEAITVHNPSPVNPISPANPVDLSWDAATRTWTTVTPIYVQTPTPGDCQGVLSVTLSANPNPAMGVNATLAPVWAGSGCTVRSVPVLPLNNPLPGSVG